MSKRIRNEKSTSVESFDSNSLPIHSKKRHSREMPTRAPALPESSEENASGPPQVKKSPFTKEELEFIVDQRSEMTGWKKVEELFRARFAGREKVTNVSLRNTFTRLLDGYYQHVSEDLQSRAIACPVSPYSTRRQREAAAEPRKHRDFTIEEKDWLVDQRRLNISWADLLQRFDAEFGNTSGVCKQDLANVLLQYEPSLVSSVRREKSLVRAPLDITILRVHQENPGDHWSQLSKKICQDEVYKTSPSNTPKGRDTLRQRWMWLNGNNITVEKLEVFIKEGANTKTVNPYEYTISLVELTRRKREAKASQDVVEGQEDDEPDDEEADENEEDDYDGISEDSEVDLYKLGRSMGFDA